MADDPRRAAARRLREEVADKAGALRDYLRGIRKPLTADELDALEDAGCVGPRTADAMRHYRGFPPPDA